MVHSTSKSSRSKNKEAEVEEHHRNLLLSKNNKHISSACNNIQTDSQEVISNVVCAMCLKCLISVNHDKCLRNYVNGKNSHGKKQKAKVIQICLWCVDSACSKHMTGNLKLLINFVWKFMGTVRFGNDHVAAILGVESQVLNYARENAHLKATYKNMFNFISVSRAQTKTIITCLQNELQSTIYKNAKLRTQLFKKVFDQKDNTHDMSENTKFAKQPIVENLLKVGETNALLKPVTSNSVSTPQESKCMNNDKVIAPGMFRINPSNTSREEKHVPNTVSASNRIKPITVSQPLVVTKKDVNSDLNGLSSTGVDNTKTRRPQPRSNTKHDRVPSASKSSRSKNKEAEVEEHNRNLLLSKNNKHISSACNNIKIDSQDVISKVVCAMCNKCLISVNHDKCLRNYVNGKNSRGKKQKAKVFVNEIQMKYQPKASKLKKEGTREVLLHLSLENLDFFLGNLKLLINFVWKFMGTVRIENDHVAAILGFGQFCDSDLEVAFRRNTCFVKNLGGVDLLKGDRSTKLYTINLYEMASASPIYLMARTSTTKSWLWHQRLSHLNFDTIHDLARNDLVAGLSSTKTSSKFEAEITSSSYGFVRTNENFQY
nr:hypothetical protein [Tanacetum cinerariifolium]